MAKTLYWLSGSPPCWKAMLTLEECGVEYNSVLKSADKQEHKAPDMLALNPRGQLPIYVDGDTVVNESLAICLYVIGQSGNKTLLPDGSSQAQVLQRFVEVNNIQTLVIGLYFLFGATKTKRQLTSEEETKKKENGEKLSKELKLWDKYLENKDYLAGNSFTVADCSFFPHLAFFVRVGLLLGENFPNLQRYYNTVSKRASVMKTWPPEWAEESEFKNVLNFIK